MVWFVQQAALLGVLAFFMAWVVQAFFAAVLLDIVDAVFICYAMDKDTQSVTRTEVHEVFSQVKPYTLWLSYAAIASGGTLVSFAP